ncbi:DUF624 domain-containing protein [Pseudactinotalea sp.]|uniref:DUF624 domain-containing protein n=1 Tax=Pseudactinotalea sp. TaxID=1926260 RepID=UPI003B3A30E3
MSALGSARPVAAARVAQASSAVTFTSALVRICSALYRLWVLHLLWVAGTLAGGIVLGVGPSTAAAYLVAAREPGEGSARQLARAFAIAYRRGFARANAFILAFVAVVAIVTAASALLPHLTGVMAIVTRGALLGALVLAAVAALGAGPAVVRFGAPQRALADLPRALRTAFLYGVARLPLTFVCALALAAMALALLQIPGLALALGPATVAALAVRLETTHPR